MKSRVRELRIGRGWSQQELAERLGVSRQTINAIEAERYEASLSLALKIGKVFGVPVEKIFQGED
jgi:putative transcriptional regulator